MTIPRRLSVIATLTVASISLAACSSAGNGEDTSPVAEVFSVANEAHDAAASSAAQAAKKAPKFSVKNNATGVSVTKPITVTSDEGDGLAKVTMTNESGGAVEGEFSGDKQTWSTTEVLGYGRTYTVTAKDKNGKSKTITFTTDSPAYTTGVGLSPLPDSTVGVGQAIGFNFSSAPEDRQAVQDAIEIETSPHVDGAFYWLSPTVLRWRPQKFWEPGTQVKVKANIYGLDMGGGLFGDADNETNFTIGDRTVSIVDDNTKTMQIWKNKKLIKTMPVSLGLEVPGRVTPNGWYTVGDQYDQLMMDSTTYGLALDAGGYQTMVDDATQLSYSGIYVHSAPWSVWAQGSQNTSHGCINVSPENAQWYLDNVKRGDVVYVKHTSGGILPATDGLGDWNMGWDEWSAGNAEQ